MNRLTRRDEGSEGFFQKKCLEARLYERLRAYEDTGLEPEEIVRQSETLTLIDFNQRIKSDRLAEIAKAEYEGRLIVLPCEFGADIFTVVTTDRSRGYRACPHPVKWVRSGKLTWLNLRSVLSEFGKTVFLTREEAEDALRGGADG